MIGAFDTGSAGRDSGQVSGSDAFDFEEVRNFFKPWLEPDDVVADISIIIGHCTFLISYVFVVVSARLAGMDDTLEQASADLGADPWVTFRRISLPQILPGVIGGALLAFIISMDDW